MAVIMNSPCTRPAQHDHILCADIGLFSRPIQPSKHAFGLNEALQPFLDAPKTIVIPNDKHSHPKSASEEAKKTAAKQYLAQIVNHLSKGPALAMLSGRPSQTTGRVTGGGFPRPASNPPRPTGAQGAAFGAIRGNGAQTASSAGSPASDQSSTRLEWSTRIRCNQYDLGSSFTVLIFLVSVPDDIEEWLTSPNYVGSFSAFVDPTGGSHSPSNIQGFVNLDDGIAKHSGQDTLDPNVVVPFLTNNLHWRVQKVDGTVAELPSLEVVVIATPVSLPPGARFPVYGEPQPYPSITYGRPGGSRDP